MPNWHIEERDGSFCVVDDVTTEIVEDGDHGRDAAAAISHLKVMYAAGPALAAAITAAAVAPVAPPSDWFDVEEPDGPEPLTIEADGRVHGHLALWDACHVGFMQGSLAECVKPPRSPSSYESFHLGQMVAADGTKIPVGKIVYGGPHANLTAGLVQARQHYDRTSSVGAFVRARDGRHGIYLAGAARSDLSPEGVRDLRANPPSGDWRRLNGALELVATLAVGIPGYQTPQVALTASGGDVAALILPGYDNTVEDDYAERKLAIREALTAAALTTRRRDELPARDFAIPADRAYPIHDEAHARNALARSAGKPEAARVRRAVCRRYPNMGECGQRKAVRASADEESGFDCEAVAGMAKSFAKDDWQQWAAAMTETVLVAEHCTTPWSSYPDNRISASSNPDRWAASWDGDICYPLWMETKMAALMNLLADGGQDYPNDLFDGLEVVVHEAEHFSLAPGVNKTADADYQTPPGEYWEEILTETVARLRTAAVVADLGLVISDPMNEDWALYQKYMPWVNEHIVSPTLAAGLSTMDVADALAFVHAQATDWRERVTSLNGVLAGLGVAPIPLDVAEAQGQFAEDWDR